MKYVWIIGGVLLVFVLIVFGFFKWMNNSSADYVLNFLKKEPKKSSIVLKENQQVVVDLRSSNMMSLASTVKIMVAMEYAYQVQEGNRRPDENISLKEIEKYYVAGLDGGAHEAWLQEVGKGETVSLREVVRGMLRYSSNANTEYLMKELEMLKIENRMKDVGVTNHSPLFYFVSCLFIPYEIRNQEFSSLSMKEAHDKIVVKMEEMTQEEWVDLSNKIHDKLTSDGGYKQRANILEWWSMEYDRLFSEKFIKSTTAEYANIMSKINNKWFPEKAQEELEYSLGSLMENEANQQWLERAGKKGGSTLTILTDALYAEDKKGNQFELAIFFNDLSWFQFQKLRVSLNDFERMILQDETYRKKVYESLQKDK